ncbi:MAG: trimeric intracellular cation channel family protein [Bacteroidota bacterium]
MTVLFALDLAGTLVFAMSGALRAARHRLDLLGVLVLATATGIGGGLIRDALLGATPAAALQDEAYLLVCIAGAMLVMLAASRVQAQWDLVRYADAIGLGVFAAMGAAKATLFGLGPFGVMMMAALTATGGGVIRDVLVREVPAVVRNDFYATAALLGGAVYALALAAGLSPNAALAAAAVVTSGLRILAMTLDLQLPRLHIGPRRSDPGNAPSPEQPLSEQPLSEHDA